MPIARLFPETTEKAALARQVVTDLRALYPSVTTFSSRAHQRLPLYFYILEQTEATRDARAAAASPPPGRFQGRTFTLLPVRRNYTTPYVEISSQTYKQILRECGLVGFTGDGRNVPDDALWKEHFALGDLETARRRFGGCIFTDGVGVSVIMGSKQSARGPRTANGFDMADARVAVAAGADVRAADPGVTEIFVAVGTDTKGAVKYSAKEYYHKAGFNRSMRRIRKWNAQRMTEAQSVPSPETASLERFVLYVRQYLAVLPMLQEHRRAGRYREERFKRFVGKQKAIKDIVDRLAPPDRFLVLGVGDWAGPTGSPISRRCTGPLKEVRKELCRRKNVMLFEVKEGLTSQRCSCCFADGGDKIADDRRLKNMVAETTRKRRQPDGTFEMVASVSKVHNVLHCRKSSLERNRRLGGCCGKTVNRDINAAKNMLMLLHRMIRGAPRPLAFVPRSREKPGGGSAD